ncbi:MAG: hypothetical protein JNM44_13970 [Chitinophagaceae bacterium]|nr:hypothetical protein [Chitinophagaceae bacterium]
MSLLNKIKDKLIPQAAPISVAPLFIPQDQIHHEFVNFSGAYRIGILSEYRDEMQVEQVLGYQKKLEKLGYDCEILFFIDNPEKEKTFYHQKFTPDDLDRKTALPVSPKTDRVIVKKYDLLLNLYFGECLPLQYVSHMSHARCRVAPFTEIFSKCSDLMIPSKPFDLDDLILHINDTLNLQPYARKTF